MTSEGLSQASSSLAELCAAVDYPCGAAGQLLDVHMLLCKLKDTGPSLSSSAMSYNGILRSMGIA